MEEINFITVGSKYFYHLISYSTKLLLKFYPDSKFFIYDWGLTHPQKKNLESYPNTILIDWTINLDKSEYKKIKLEKNMYGDSDTSKEYEYLFCQKSLCMLDCAKRIKKNLIYLDGDAFLINKIDELFKQDFDIGITIRLDKSVYDISKKLGVLTFINAGVIFFNSDTENIQLFLNEWIEEIKNTTGLWLDQTALNNMISRTNEKIFSKYYSEGILKISNRDLKIKTLPCSIYNHYEIKEGFNPKNTKILHFRVSQQGIVNKERIREIIIEFRLGPFYYHFLKLFPKQLRKYIKESFSIFFLVKLINNPFKIKKWVNELIISFKKLNTKI